MDPQLLNPETIFKMNVLRGLENANLRLGFANTVYAYFNYAFFQLLYKQASSLQPSKITRI